MIRISLSAGLLLLAAAAHAQQPASPQQSAPAQGLAWSGPYIGVVAGAARGNVTSASSVECAAGGFLCDPGSHGANGALLGATATGSHSSAVFSAGLAAGYNFRFNQFVLGAEGDISAANLKVAKGGDAASLNPGLVNPGSVPVVASVKAQAEINWLATLRGRVGYVVLPNLMIYATGGLAWKDMTVSYSYTDNWTSNGGAVGKAGSSSQRVGRVFGAGAEWSLPENWTLRAEYMRVLLGSDRLAGEIAVVDVPAAKNPFTSSSKLTADLFRIGSSYRF